MYGCKHTIESHILLSATVLLAVFLLIFRNGQASATIPFPAQADSATVYNNLANYYLLEADTNEAAIDTAFGYYELALAYDSTDPGIKLNLAIAHLMVDDTLTAIAYIGEAYEQAGKNAKALYSMLGLQYIENTGGAKAGAKTLSEAELRKWMATGIDKKKRGTGSAGSKKKKPAGKKGRSKSGGKPKNLKPAELQSILYWR